MADHPTGNFTPHPAPSPREHRRFSYAGTTTSGDSGILGSGYSVSSILQGSEHEHMMDSMSSMASTSAPDTEMWQGSHTPPHSAPPTSRNESFDYFHPPATSQPSAPTFSEAYVSNPAAPLRSNLWSHPFHHHRAAHFPGTHAVHERIAPWNPPGSVGSLAGSGTMTAEDYSSSSSRLPVPWSHETTKYGINESTQMHNNAMLHHSVHHHKTHSAHASESSSDGGSVSSPAASPAYYAAHTSHFTFPPSHHVPTHSHSGLHRTKSSPTTFGRDVEGVSQGGCAVCGDHASCQHYGVRTCEGCKGFFKRTVQKGAKYVCLANKDCPVDKKRRNRCQFCRYQKCLNVGMVKEVVRTDSLKGRRGRLPSKPRNLAERDLSSRTTSATAVRHPHNHNSGSRGMDMITSLQLAHHESSPQVHLDYHALAGSAARSSHEDVERFLSVMTHSLTDVVAVWAEKVPGFRTELVREDRDILIRYASGELLSLRLAYRLLTDAASGPDNVRFCNGVVYPKDMVAQIMGTWFSAVEDLSRVLASMELDTAAFSALCALVLVRDRPYVTDTNAVQRLQAKISDALREYVLNTRSAHNVLPHLLPRIQDVQAAGAQFTQRLQGLHQQYPTVKFPDGLLQFLGTRADVR